MRIDIGKEVKEIAEKMTMQAIENQEEFIFETIRPYCENVLQIKINKEELKQILLNSVQKQQPKTGHWIKVTNGRGGHECDLCHEYAPSYQSGKEYLTKYCPKCGAKMEVEE